MVSNKNSSVWGRRLNGKCMSCFTTYIAVVVVKIVVVVVVVKIGRVKTYPKKFKKQKAKFLNIENFASESKNKER